MKKILITTFAAAAAFAAISASADHTVPFTTSGPYGIECARLDYHTPQIHCNKHPWLQYPDGNPEEQDVLTFDSIQDIYDHGYKVVSMMDIADEHGGQYGYTDFIIEKR